MRKILWILSILFLTCSLSYAAPTISGISGTVGNGESITISGSSNGTGSTIVSWDNFEAHTTGTSVSGKSPIVGPTWSLYRLSPSTDDVNISTTRSHSGSKSVMIEWTDENINSFGWTGQGPYTQLYITWWGYQQFSGSITSANRKWFYLYGPSTCGALNEAPQAMPLIPEGQTTWGYYNNVSTQQPNWSGMNNMSSNTTYGTGHSVSWSATNGVWNRWEYWQKLNDPYNCTVNSNCNGELTYWVDAVKRFERTDYKHRWCSPAWVDFRLGHMWQGHIDNATYAWIDDVFIATSQARVELGNASTWNGCTHREIQRHTSWGASSITVTLNTGTFTSGQTAYLYVVDSTGAPSNGYQVTIGGAVEDTTPPSVGSHSPAKSATAVPVDTNISFVISDGGSGVDVNSIDVEIEGATHCCSQMVGTCPDSGTKDLSCTGSSAAVTVTKGSNTFANEQVVNITTNASDNEDNAMTADTWSFTCADDPPDVVNPVMTVTSPPAGYTYVRDSAITATGTMTDDVALTTPPGTWANDKGGSGNITMASPPNFSVDITGLTASTFGSNIEANGEFTSDHSGWTAYNATVTQGNYGGRTCVSVADNGSWSELYKTFTVDDGDWYLVYVIARSVGVDWTENGCILIDHAAARTDTWGDVQIDAISAADTWTIVAGIVQASGTSMTVRLHSEESYTAYFDNVIIKKVSTANGVTFTAEDTSTNTDSETRYVVYDTTHSITSDQEEPPPVGAPKKVMVYDADGRLWQYDADGVTLVSE